MIRKAGGNSFYCFSPPIMLATFFIEIGYLLFIVIRYKVNALTKLVAAILLLLAVFQLAEYYVCGGIGASATTWSRIGFACITLLPPLGVHLVHQIAGKKFNLVTAAAYGTSVAWISIFLFSETIFRNYVCSGNYVIFKLAPALGGMYFMYYYFWLIVGVILSLKLINSVNKPRREALILFIVGYLALLLPVSVTNNIKPETLEGLPSIMCGFAIILATILTFGVMPKVGKRKLKSGKVF